MKKLTGVFTTLLLPFALVACGPDVDSACEKVCGKNAECGAPTSGCVGECKDDMEDADGDCQREFVEFADCYDGMTCAELTGSSDKCAGEALKFLGECGDDFGIFNGIIDSAHRLVGLPDNR